MTAMRAIPETVTKHRVLSQRSGIRDVGIDEVMLRHFFHPDP
jgi:hypothetical protein